jgi:transcription antitermination factor NusG
VKTLFINKEAEITDGVLKGFKGKVVGYDSIENEVMVKLDEKTFVTVPSEYVKQ